MKRSLLTLALVLLIGASFSQHLTQDFSGSFPPSGWTIENYTSQWTQVNSSNAGGTAPELRFMYTSGSLTTRFISPSIDLTGVANLTLSFKHFVDHYGSGYTVGVATRSNSGTWNVVWSVSPTADIGPETKDIIISNGDVGSSTFQFCFFLSGNAYNIDYWYIDDVVLFTPYNVDLKLEKINVNDFVTQGDVDVSATVKNAGINPITSFVITYQVDGGDLVFETVEGVTITSNQTYTHTFSQNWLATAGVRELVVVASNINDAGDDDYVANNSLTKTIQVASNSVPSLPLFESFTSSTCGPCKTYNTNTFNPFLNNHIGEYAIIKYQMNWPGAGDPYYTAEGGVRRTYYGVNAVPQLFTGGVPTSITVSNPTLDLTTLTNDFNREKNKEAYFVIDANASIEGTTVSADINITPYINASNFKLHAAVVERETTGNVGTNGETSFKYVMMKMLPNANGTTVNFVDGEEYSISFTQNMASTKVEEFDDLILVVFIQNDVTKEIFQSKMINIPLATYTVMFNVVDESEVAIEGALVSIDGEEFVTDENGIVSIELTSGTYAYTVSKEGYLVFEGEVVVADDLSVDVTLEALEYFTFTFLVIKADETAIEGASIEINDEVITTNEQGIATIELSEGEYPYTVTKTGYEEFTGTLNVVDQDENVTITLTPITSIIIGSLKGTSLFPNPTSGSLTIGLPRAMDNVKVEIYNVTGSLVYSQLFNAENSELKLNINQPQGVYMVKVTRNNGDTSTHKLIVR